MKEKILWVVLGLAIVGGLIYYQAKSKTEETPTIEQQTTPTPTPTNEATESAELKEYTLAEVALHSSASDCWLAIEGMVYDVTPFIASKKHPGGSAILQGCGKDATTLFNTRPMGSKTPHSSTARSYLPKFKIGTLVQ